MRAEVVVGGGHLFIARFKTLHMAAANIKLNLILGWAELQ